MDGFMGLPNSLVANLHFTGMVANRATGGMLFNDWIPQGSLEMQPVTKTKAKSTTENTEHTEGKTLFAIRSSLRSGMTRASPRKVKSEKASP